MNLTAEQTTEQVGYTNHLAFFDSVKDKIGKPIYKTDNLQKHFARRIKALMARLLDRDIICVFLVSATVLKPYVYNSEGHLFISANSDDQLLTIARKLEKQAR